MMIENNIASHSPDKKFEFPDPYSCLNLKPYTGDRERRVEYNARRSRHAEILASARKLMSSADFADFTIKELASACGLSKQSVHNHFGDRVSLISAALTDYNRAVWDCEYQSREETVEKDEMFGFIDKLHKACEMNPEFYARVISNLHSSPFGRAVFEKSFPLWINEIFSILMRMRQRMNYNAQFNPRLMAESLTTLNSYTMRDWATGLINLDRLKRDLYQQNGAILSSIFDQDYADYVAKCLREIK